MALVVSRIQRLRVALAVRKPRATSERSPAAWSRSWFSCFGGVWDSDGDPVLKAPNVGCDFVWMPSNLFIPLGGRSKLIPGSQQTLGIPLEPELVRPPLLHASVKISVSPWFADVFGGEMRFTLSFCGQPAFVSSYPKRRSGEPRLQRRSTPSTRHPFQALHRRRDGSTGTPSIRRLSRKLVQRIAVHAIGWINSGMAAARYIT